MNQSPFASAVLSKYLFRLTQEISDGRPATADEARFMAQSFMWLLNSMIRETDLK